MSKKFYFNWYDLLLKSKKDHDAIIILTYALTIPYNKKIANNSLSLIRKLHIHKVPKWLNNNFKIAKTFEIFNLYTVEEPQSYFVNPQFLSSVVPMSSKVNYLWLLSHRKNDNNDSFIPKDYFTKEELNGIKNNPFITIDNNNINFIFETT